MIAKLKSRPQTILIFIFPMLLIVLVKIYQNNLILLNQGEIVYAIATIVAILIITRIEKKSKYHQDH